jgi:hypothetical protein
VPAKLDPLIIDEMRDLYESGHSFSSIATRCRVAVNSVKKHAAAGGWNKPTPETLSRENGSDDPDDAYQTSNDDQIAILEAGAAMRILIHGHQKEWKEIERIRRDALLAYKDDKFKPEDAPDSWNSRDRLAHAGRLFSMYNTASNALMVAQEGERRAYGFDYREQKKQSQAEGRDHARQAELMDELMAALETLTEGKIIDGEWHELLDVGAAAADDQAPVPEGATEAQDHG